MVMLYIKYVYLYKDAEMFFQSFIFSVTALVDDAVMAWKSGR